MKIAELLHFCLTARRSGEIRFDDSSFNATIFIRDGEVIAAEYKDIQGEAAFFALLLQEDLENQFFEKSVQISQNISKSTHFLLMEAARISDEAASKKSQTSAEKPSKSGGYCLRFITMDNAKFALVGHSITIGRDKGCDISVPDVSVSATHCQILWNGEKHLLSDMNSFNGTFLNREQIKTSQALSTGDHIQVGLCHFCYEQVLAKDHLKDPRSVIPFTFGSETQKIELPTQKGSGPEKQITHNDFKDYQPVDDQ